MQATLRCKLRLGIGFVCVAILLAGCSTAHASERSPNGFDVSNATIPVREIRLGGPPRDGIPAIHAPTFVSALSADAFLDSDDRVLGVAIDTGDGVIARAYPIRILDWHEVVNDRVAERGIVITYCPLCGTGMVFASERRFGVSGLLYNSDVLLYDLETESLWSQILATAISGPRVGDQLAQLPALHTTWQEWRARHPETQVLSERTGFGRDYAKSPYAGYEKSRKLYFPVRNVGGRNKASRRFHPKERVVGVRIGGAAKAYPFVTLAEYGRAQFTDRIGGVPVVVRWQAEAQSAEVLDVDGSPLPSTQAFWFAWHAFHPETQVFAPES